TRPGAIYRAIVGGILSPLAIQRRVDGLGGGRRSGGESVGGSQRRRASGSGLGLGTAKGRLHRTDSPGRVLPRRRWVSFADSYQAGRGTPGNRRSACDRGTPSPGSLLRGNELAV